MGRESDIVTQSFHWTLCGWHYYCKSEKRSTNPCGSPDRTGIVLRTGFCLQLLFLVS